MNIKFIIRPYVFYFILMESSSTVNINVYCMFMNNFHPHKKIYKTTSSLFSLTTNSMDMQFKKENRESKHIN